MRNKRTFAVKVVTSAMDAARRVVYGRSALDACAQQLGKSHQTLSKQLNEEDGNGLRVRELEAIELFMDTDAFAECAAARRDGIFMKLPPTDGAGLPEEVTRGWAKLIAEFAEASAAFSDAVSDGRITPVELVRFQKEVRDVYSAGEKLVQVARARMLSEVRK